MYDKTHYNKKKIKKKKTLLHKSLGDQASSLTLDWNLLLQRPRIPASFRVSATKFHQCTFCFAALAPNLKFGETIPAGKQYSHLHKCWLQRKEETLFCFVCFLHCWAMASITVNPSNVEECSKVLEVQKQWQLFPWWGDTLIIRAEVFIHLHKSKRLTGAATQNGQRQVDLPQKN